MVSANPLGDNVCRIAEAAKAIDAGNENIFDIATLQFVKIIDLYTKGLMTRDIMHYLQATISNVSDKVSPIPTGDTFVQKVADVHFSLILLVIC